MRTSRNPNMYTMRHSWEGLLDIACRWLQAGTKMVEIGSYAGESSELWAKSGKVAELFCVDPWINGYDPSDKASLCCPMKEVEREFDDNMSRVLIPVTKLRMTSAVASLIVKDGSLDFVYIDGNHQFHYINLDLEKWLPKIKPGGLIGGHDWDKSDIRAAVQKWVGEPDEVFGDTSWIKRIN